MAELMDDIVFNEALVTPGYRVEAVVGTTYSMDLGTLLEVPIALEEISVSAKDYLQKPHYLLDIISRMAHKLCIFCNAGSIYSPFRKVEGERNSLIGDRILTLLEQCIYPIHLSTTDKICNFHPKIWCILESKKDGSDRQVKVMVMSRNLTYSHDLDAVCVLTGKVYNKVTDAERPKHQPLIDFLQWLYENSGPQKKCSSVIYSLIDALKKVKSFNQGNSMIADYCFLPMGITQYDGKRVLDELQNQKGDMIVLSPFVDKETLESLTKQKKRMILITRPETCTEPLRQLVRNALYVPKASFGSDEEDSMEVNLHAKMYFSFDGKNKLYVGSTNATHNGFANNVEFLLALTFKPYQTSFNQIYQQLITENGSLYEPAICISSSDPNEDMKREMQRILRLAISKIAHATVETNQNGLYRVLVDAQHLETDYPISLAPIYRKEKQVVYGAKMVFESLTLSDLSELYLLTCGEVCSVIRIYTMKMPKGREENIIKLLLDTPQKVIDYLSYMLSFDPEGYLEDMLQRSWQKGDSNTSNGNVFSGLHLYEDLLRMTYQDPERIIRAKEIISRCSKEVEISSLEKLLDRIGKVIPRIKQMKKGEKNV